MDFLGSTLNKVRPRRRSVGTIIPTLQVIPDNDQPVTFTPDDPEDEARLGVYRKQSQRRSSCPVNAKVSMLFKALGLSHILLKLGKTNFLGVILSVC